MKIFSGTASKNLAQKTADVLKIKLSKLELRIFPDEEKRIRVVEKIIGEECIVVQSASTIADKNYMELFFIADALKRSGAKAVTAVIPYLGYQRQDHVFRDGEAVSLEVVIKILDMIGVDKVIVFDLHSIRRIKLLSSMLDNMPYATIEKNRDLATGDVSVTGSEGLNDFKRAVMVDD